MVSFRDFNIILITLDGLRQDRIPLCPNLQNFCNSSLYFPKMFTCVPYTFASHHAIFSGTYPSRNGVDAYYHILDFKKDEIITLPQILKKADYFTCCDIIDDTVITSQGFDEYRLFDETKINFIQRHTSLIEQTAKNGKFFLFLHYTELHRDIVKKVIQEDKGKSNDNYFNSKSKNENRYNLCLPSLDKYVKAITDTLQNNKILDNTILIFIADHGMSLGEKKGEKFYGVYVYDYTINVFCAMKIPGLKPQIIKNQCSTIDLFSTIREIAGITFEEDLKQVQGKSLFPLIEGKETTEREIFVETGGLYGPWPSPYKHNVFCVRKENKKLIYNDTPQTWEFYNLESDPDELNNLYDGKSDEIKNFKQRLRFYLQENNIVTNLSSK